MLILVNQMTPKRRKRKRPRTRKKNFPNPNRRSSQPPGCQSSFSSFSSPFSSSFSPLCCPSLISLRTCLLGSLFSFVSSLCPHGLTHRLPVDALELAAVVSQRHQAVHSTPALCKNQSPVDTRIHAKSVAEVQSALLLVLGLPSREIPMDKVAHDGRTAVWAAHNTAAHIGLPVGRTRSPRLQVAAAHTRMGGRVLVAAHTRTGGGP